jgi:chromosome segregation ATPase
VTKKGPGSRDHRSEPDAGGSSNQFRVDRVFIAPRPVPASAAIPGKRPTTPPATVAEATQPPPVVGRADTETELSLRRQLARLQHQLSESQRELANRDEEVAAAVEKRIEIQSAYDVLLDQHRELLQRAHDAEDVATRVTGIEERLATATAEADELRHQLERERSERATIALQLDEAVVAFERARKEWRDESSLIDQQHATQLAQLDHQKRAALDAAEQAKTAALDRQREAYEAEIDALRVAHEREVAAMSGELEPKVAEARNLSAEIERLTSELAASHAEQQTLLAERIELHKWETAQAEESHAAELAAQARTHATEIARLNELVSAANQAGELIERKASLREQLWDQTVSKLRESQKKLQQELAQEKEKAAQAEGNTTALEQRVAAAQETIDKLETEVRELRKQLEVVDQETRHSGFDRERFAAYLEQGLAMLGKLPPAGDDDITRDHPLPREDGSRGSQPRLADTRHASEPRFAPDLRPGAVRHPSAHDRPTAQFAAILEPPDVELEIEAEAPPLPDPREPTRH